MLHCFAVHISDGILLQEWWLSGWCIFAIAVLIGLRKLDEKLIPKIGVLAAAFFISSQIHFRLGITSVHLLLNGLLGVLLGWRAVVAIFVGLVLQAWLFGHGGWTSLGINGCVITIPAILANVVFQRLYQSQWLQNRWGRLALVTFICATVISLSLLALAMLRHQVQEETHFQWEYASWLLDWPWLLGILLVALGCGFAERRLQESPEFTLGLLIGILAVSLTLTLHAGVLAFGTERDFSSIIAVSILAHTPVILLEGLAVGFAVKVLAKAKPEWLRQSELLG